MSIALDALYIGAATIAAPYVLVRMALSKRWRAGLVQRLGLIEPRAGDRPCLWLHCASVGEALNVRSFLGQLRDALPEWEVVVSTNTNTGMEVLHKRYPDLRAFYYPLDLSGCVARTFRRIRPDCVALFELEAWPNCLSEAARRDVPVVVINGRVNPATVRAHRWLRWLAGDFWARGRRNAYGVQNETYADRFAQLGIAPKQIQVTGNVKYDNIDLAADPDAKARLEALFQIEPDDVVLVGGSTWDGEEQALLTAFEALRPEIDRLRLILVPRHVERADAVAGLVQAAGLPVVRKTGLDAGEEAPVPLRSAVLLVDTVGDLATVYTLARVAFVGKSLVPLGGQNMLEPAGIGVPVVFGPHTSNFAKESDLLLSRQAARCVSDTEELTAVVKHLLTCPEEASAMGERARQVITENTGAAQRSVAIVLNVLERKEREQ